MLCNLHCAMESRAITAFNTGHLVFRSIKQFGFKSKLGGTNRCLFDNCNNIDTLYHAMWGCEWYKMENITPKDTWRDEGMSVSKDLAEYLIKLHEFRMNKWGVPLIVVDRWL